MIEEPLIEWLFYFGLTYRFYISQAFHIASFCGTGAVIFISSLLTGWMNSSILA